MKKIIIIVISFLNLFGNSCDEKEIEKLKNSHNKMYLGYIELKKNKDELGFFATDYLNKSILMGLIAGDCQSQLKKKEIITLETINEIFVL